MTTTISRKLRIAAGVAIAAISLVTMGISEANAAPLAPTKSATARSGVVTSVSPYMDTMRVPTAGCIAQYDARSVVTVGVPQMRAANATGGSDWQHFAYRANLYRYSSYYRDWRLYRTGVWRFGQGSDEFGPVNWRTSDGTAVTGGSRFYSVPAGYYAVQIQGHWYATANIHAQGQSAFVTHHAQFSRWNSYCSFAR